MIGGNAWPTPTTSCATRASPRSRVADEENHGLHALYRLYRAEAGWVFLAAPRQPRVGGAGRRRSTARTSPPTTRFATDGQSRRAQRRRARRRARRACSPRAPPSEWEAHLTAAGVACVEAFDASHSEFTCTDPVLRETGLVVEVEHPLFGPILRAGPAGRVLGDPGTGRAGCLVGQHTEAILTELGYAPERIEELEALGTVFASDTTTGATT